MPRSSIFLGVFLTTLAVLALELALTRLFSATMYYHFAFLAISVALFGSGASGVFVFLAGGRLAKYSTPTLLALFNSLFAISVVAALATVLGNPVSAEAVDSSSLWLTQIYVATALPFFFAGCTVTVAISRLASDASRLYLFDLAGAAMGCLLLIPLLNRLGGVNTVLSVSVIASLASLVFAFQSDRAIRFLAIIAFAAVGSLLTFNLVTNRISVRFAKGAETTDVVFSKWNSFSHITVHGRPDSPFLRIAIDADADTAVIRNAGRYGAVRTPPVTIEGLVHHIKRNANVLIIGPGGGRDVLIARLFGQKQVTGVELNRLIADDVMRSEPFRTYSGDLYFQPGVNIVVDEGRSFIRSSYQRYDILQATMVDTWAATAAGAFSLAENNLYTVEAFKDYITHLEPDGVLSMTRWYLEPPDQVMRLITITREAMRELGIGDPARHFIIVRNRHRPQATATFLFKRSVFTDDEVAVIEAAARSGELTIVYSPRTRPRGAITDLITAGDPKPVWEALRSNVAPTRDNNPFFFNTLRISHLGDAFRGSSEWRKTNLGTYVLMLLLGISFAMVVIFIVVPMFVARGRDLRKTRGSLSVLFYFAALGLGFILIEVAMIQKFILFVGHPVYALVVVLFSLFCFCGIGSYLTTRFDPARSLPIVIAAVVAVAVLYVLVLPPIFYGLVQLPQMARIGLAVLFLAPLSLLMGMPMPLGIRLVTQRSPEIIPWAWGINGATSVLGSVSALVMAILTGFNQVIVIGAAIYLAALFLARRMTRVSAV